MLRRRGVRWSSPAWGAWREATRVRVAWPTWREIVAAAAASLARPTPTTRPADPAPAQAAGVLVTAGGTREPIDPVRFLGNRSSGKQGHALAAAARAGAPQSLWSRPSRPTRPGPAGGEVVRWKQPSRWPPPSAPRPHADVIIMAAAVADFRPKAAADHKLKKADGVPDLVLEPTPDILADLAPARRPGQLLVGFAAETAGAMPSSCGAMPVTSCAASTLTWWWPTMSRSPGSVSATRPTPW